MLHLTNSKKKSWIPKTKPKFLCNILITKGKLISRDFFSENYSLLYSTNFTKFFSNIRDGKVEVMPLPPKNYSELKVKELDLRESITLQQEQDKRLKKIQLQNALDKLTGGSSKDDNTGIGIISMPEKYIISSL